MAVVINDFEVELESPRPETAGHAATAQRGPQNAAGAALTPEDLRQVDAHLAARAERVSAD